MTFDSEPERPILLIGAGGQLGGEFVQQFRRHGVPVVKASSQAPSLASRHAGIDDPSLWRHVDISSRNSLVKLIDDVQPRVLINASAYTAVDQAQTERSLAERINADAPRIMAESCAALGTTLVHFSTDYVFDGRSTRAYIERDLPRPLNEYGLSKWRGEQAVLGMDAGHFVFRTSWLYAAGGRNFVTTMLRLFRGESVVRVVDDQYGCPTWARDLAAALTTWLLATPAHTLREQAGLYHLCSAGECSWYEFAAAIRERMTPVASAELLAIDSATFGASAQRPPRSVLDCSAARDALNLQLPHWIDALDAAMPSFSDAARTDH